ncbi:efflux transporter outer membrane subunit [Klebsiella quasipneumoniae subsp. quasipneumoniae]|uniref:efflux transporter outer membrane subunit n=1 Tax=Klebsiella quasipneumoniae TaxID=1463165 RepID=UPI001E2C496A|nr:efflux transporter outer membrane subunit [Klebsiella quasipneumoniae]MCD7095351.1 efflux transporter outer membrane subunit [Klebsiella quasipneumoniae subsp. similipneumoniae]
MVNSSVTKSFLAAIIAVALTGCNLQPAYNRPALPVSNQWRDKATVGLNVAEMQWPNFFTDPILRQLITEALENNRDLKVAALNVESARAQLGLTQADLLPTIDASVNKTAEHLPGNLYSTQNTGPVTYQQYEGNLAVSSWELDFFGRLQSLRDQALENYFSYEATQKATQLSLVAEVAQAYITLSADSDLYKLAMSTAESQRESLRMAQAKFNAGTVTEQDVLQARTTVKSAEADVAKYDRQRKQDGNALQLLLGAALPSQVFNQATLHKKWIFPELNAGLPSDVLTRRPDIIAAEHSLKAANANIGAARAAFFPSISLTASGGSASSSLGHLFEAGTAAWSFGPSINLPIFDGGKNRANLDVAKVTKRIEVANYEKAIQQAFKEVSDALSGTETYKREVSSRQEDMEANDKYYQLAKVRYDSGVDDYTEVLTAQRSLYTAEQDYISTFSDSLSQKVTLFKVLGGGWK